MTLPLVRLTGEPFDQGRQHGLALRDRIAHNLDVYYDRFLTEAQLDRPEVRRRALHLLAVLEGQPYYDAVRGVASGSDLDVLDLLVLNLRYELLYYQYSVLPVAAGPDGCTTVALRAAQTANNHVLVGENWDWIPEVQGAVLHTQDDGLETLAFTEAGIVGGKIGLNSAGLGLAMNGLLTTVDDWARPVKPFHVRAYEILRCASLREAADVIRDQPRACSTNFLLAQVPDQVLDIEAAPDALCELREGVVAHTNHFLDPHRLGVEEPTSERRPHTYTRLARITDLVEARMPVSVADLQASLRDHDNYPDSVCRHFNPQDLPQEACTTVVSAVMDLQERALWLTDGPPCEHHYERYAL